MNLTCQYYQDHTCRSCRLLDHSYQEGLRLKEERLRALFPHDPLVPLIPSPKIWGSRNKAKLAVTGTVERPILGLVDESFAGRELLECPLHLKGLSVVLQELKVLISQLQLTPYDIQNRQGELKYLILHQSESTGEIMVRLVLRSRKLEKKLRALVPMLREKCPEVKVVSMNIQEIPQAILEGPREIVLTKQRWITHHLEGVSLLSAPKCFFQTNSQVAALLYQHVGQIMQQLRPTSALDLYCGIGAFSFFSSPWCPDIIGVEISQESIHCARMGREILAQQIPQAYSTEQNLSAARPQLEFFSEDVDSFLDSYRGTPEVVIANPPRSGLSAKALTHILRLAPQSLIYSSCNPHTLQRDLESLRADYDIQSLTPFDMFPLTEHVEVAAFLQRKPQS